MLLVGKCRHDFFLLRNKESIFEYNEGDNFGRDVIKSNKARSAFERFEHAPTKSSPHFFKEWFLIISI